MCLLLLSSPGLQVVKENKHLGRVAIPGRMNELGKMAAEGLG
jgi:hypothetical protein